MVIDKNQIERIIKFNIIPWDFQVFDHLIRSLYFLLITTNFLKAPPYLKQIISVLLRSLLKSSSSSLVSCVACVVLSWNLLRWRLTYDFPHPFLLLLWPWLKYNFVRAPDSIEVSAFCEGALYSLDLLLRFVDRGIYLFKSERGLFPAVCGLLRVSLRSPIKITLLPNNISNSSDCDGWNPWSKNLKWMELSIIWLLHI